MAKSILKALSASQGASGQADPRAMRHSPSQVRSRTAVGMKSIQVTALYPLMPHDPDVGFKCRCGTAR